MPWSWNVDKDTAGPQTKRNTTRPVSYKFVAMVLVFAVIALFVFLLCGIILSVS